MPAKTTSGKGGTMRPRYYRVLSLDGGGIRGILTAVWLARLERELGTKKLKDCFDLVAGTSTGSILACAVSMGLPAAQIIEMYREYGREIFPGVASRLWSRATRVFSEGLSAPKYEPDGLERALRREFGDTLFGDLHIRPTLVTAYDALGRRAVVFKSTRDRHKDLPAWEVAKASSSAPTYFPAHVTQLQGATVPLLDGGVVANNPAACAVAEAVRVNTEAKSGYGLGDVLVASFGTGESTRPITVEDSQEWGALEWAVPIIGVLFDGAGDATDYVVRQLVGKSRYFRFQTPLRRGYDDMDNADATNLDALVNTANAYLENDGAGERIEKLAKMLKSRRRVAAG